MDNELIKKYLTNELSPQDRNAFEQEMENDPFLMEAVEGLMLQHSTWDKAQIQQLENELHQKIDQKIQQPQSGKIIPLHFFRYAAAACVIGILAFTSWRLFLSPEQLDEQAIYASYFHPLTHPDATVRGENAVSDETAAVQAYEKEDYFGAVKYYEKLVANNPENIKNNLFLGISLLATNQAQKAVDVLNKINTSNDFHFDVQWYLAMAYLKNKDVQHALDLFSALSKEDNYYQKQSAEIVEKLDGKTASIH